MSEVSEGDGGDFDAGETAADDGGSGRAIGRTDVPTDVGDPPHDLTDRRRVAAVGVGRLAQDDDGVDFVARQLDGCRFVWLLASQMLESFGSHGYRGKGCGPTDDGLPLVKQRRLNLAV